MKYVLVQWSSGNIKTSILTENYVRDKSMLYDCTKEGIISFVTVQRGDTSVVKNKGKLGRIACVSDDRKLVEEHQNLLLAEESEFIEDEIESPSPPRSSKRPRTETDNEIGQHGTKRVASNLQEELLAEKAKVRELQILNQTLQKKLPELLRNAMHSSKVIIKLRTCPNCNQCYGSNGSTVANISTIAPEPTITTQDGGPSTPNVAKTMPDKPPIRSVHSPTSDSTPMQMLDLPMVPSQPSTVDLSTDFGSPEQPSTPDTDLAMTLPGMSTTTSEADNMLHELSTPESLGIVPLCNQSEGVSLNAPPTENTQFALQPFEVTYAMTYRKMTLALLSHLFDQDTLKLSSVTGTGLSKRPALEKTKVQYIIDTVKKRFPDVTPKAIKATMAQKCKYLRKPTRKSNTSMINDDINSSMTEDKSVIED